MKEENILCGAGGLQQKFYMNPRFSRLPESVQQELKGALGALAEQAGGTILLEYQDTGDLDLHRIRDEGDIDTDEIGTRLLIDRLLKEKEELFLRLKAFYLAFYGDHS